VLARGETLIENAACEPEIVDLADCLNAMGARVEGAGTSTIKINGVPRLHGATHAVVPDRIEAGTYAMAVAMAGGDVTLTGVRSDHMAAFLERLQATGVEVDVTQTTIRVRRRPDVRLKAVDVETQPFPGFATDLQAQFMALMTLADGQSVIRETIFENRFMHAGELARMGADISVQGGEAHVRGVDGLTGAPVAASDVRASVCLVIAGLAARGQTVVEGVHHLDRGFERLEEKLRACGADIQRLTGSKP
jgi:UDP-N-acetylglucosamine 1-carboxyvinyltransferase